MIDPKLAVSGLAGNDSEPQGHTGAQNTALRSKAAFPNSNKVRPAALRLRGERLTVTSRESRLGTENFDPRSAAARGSNSRGGDGAQAGSRSLLHASDHEGPERPNDHGSKLRRADHNSSQSQDASPLHRRRGTTIPSGYRPSSTMLNNPSRRRREPHDAANARHF